MTSFEAQVQEAVDERRLPGLILLASNATGIRHSSPSSDQSQLTKVSRDIQIREGLRAQEPH